ncbi:glycosyltransferase [Paenibacillus sp. NPDC056722]|uniref:glycosyltransferase n=1 Tax=Paenibacillus sp. NPDC056722 TaxID=3345924 RepID=UPI0036831E5B
MNSPLVSIIIPVYNGGNYLHEAIDSALAQTYSNIEVIVVNDGSNDNGLTESIALSYQDKIRYVPKENGGVATALNLGVKLMKGEYFSWLSHDDLYQPNKIEKQIKELQNHGESTAIIYSDYHLKDEKTGLCMPIQHHISYPVDRLGESVFPVLQGLVHGCSLLIHKSHFKRVGIFNEDLITTQDYDLWFRMFRHQKLIYLEESLMISRLHDLQGSKTLNCHDSEREQLYLNFLKELTVTEIISMYGSPYNFYHRMCVFLKGGKMSKAYKYAEQEALKCPIPEDFSGKISELQHYIQGISQGKAENICIFGVGEYGARLFEELQSKSVVINFFSDNNPDKWGEVWGIKCISPEKLEKVKNHTLVIVANRLPGDILKQLDSLGFNYVTTKQEIDKVLFGIPPIKINVMS